MLKDKPIFRCLACRKIKLKKTKIFCSSCSALNIIEVRTNCKSFGYNNEEEFDDCLNELKRFNGVQLMRFKSNNRDKKFNIIKWFARFVKALFIK